MGFIKEILIYHQLFTDPVWKQNLGIYFFIFTFDPSITSLDFSYLFSLSVHVCRITDTKNIHDLHHRCQKRWPLKVICSDQVSLVSPRYDMLFYGINISDKRVCKRAGSYAFSSRINNVHSLEIAKYEELLTTM